MDGDAKTMTFLQEVVDILLAYIVESFDRETKVIDFHYPNELLQLNNWELQDGPANLDDILISCRATLKYAIKTGRPEPRLELHLEPPAGGEAAANCKWKCKNNDDNNNDRNSVFFFLRLF